ncbi:hypothetical protein O1Q79_01047 [Lonepinella sp. MS14434]|uniref:hypothetical protein n=1 Tax=Lonepinella sp. MS14434 TaxID=3003617 RepID=UPI0036DDECBB
MALNPTEIYENLEKLVKKNLTRVPKIENDGNGTERNGTERNGTERNGTERNGTERNGTELIVYL